MAFYPHILNPIQAQILPKLSFTKPQFYLGGGTALALQLGHRTSVDFDFYAPQKFDNQKLGLTISQLFPNVKTPATHLYQYPLLDQLVDYGPVLLAGLRDIAAMKTAAVVQRARQRDFYDIYYLIKKLGVETFINATYQKFPWYEENNVVVFTSLTYFTEADVVIKSSVISYSN
ncbi:MAG: hypothetical protein UX92_C0030G0002 [Candidatus Amesbacteria bacterium GW2011_GWA1_47_20]|uniref:Nucleotidyl transferase AbiEii toxin, Type IV TA system n=1 Tax=Candidatus Amesbacteria bacterium GW2011_GWA1_47_20 TaxID=1618354 RepID=A0A0G1SDK3_9BACT|nr:MAG: hypothetical protein UX92_C0030G0002 [Candidatus Amesbacteria bacterium GW2011_GWA1_47_20]